MKQASSVVLLAFAYPIWRGFTTQHAWYRFTTAMQSIYNVATMPQAQIEGFLKSYEIFEQDFFSGSDEEVQNLLAYYGVLNHLCAIGDFEKMYLPPRIDPQQGVYENQMLYEKRMADALNIGPGSKVLDIGCGRGRIAYHVASYTGAHVTGINIDPVQLGYAEAYAKQKGLYGQTLDFKRANYNDPLPFPDNHFDALYYVQVLSYPTDLERFFAETFRVVKPGGMVAFEDYTKGPSYNETDPRQKQLLRLAKPVLGGVVEVKPAVLVAAIKAVGFEVVSSQDESVGGDWPLLQDSADFFLPMQSAVAAGGKMGLVPDHFLTMLERMNRGADALIEASKEGVVNLGWVTIARKPA